MKKNNKRVSLLNIYSKIIIKINAKKTINKYINITVLDNV